ncbi:MAG: hypothetical protein WBV55_11480 [Candidatus Sulfotelmatobacter sp.]
MTLTCEAIPAKLLIEADSQGGLGYHLVGQERIRRTDSPQARVTPERSYPADRKIPNPPSGGNLPW